MPLLLAEKTLTRQGDYEMLNTLYESVPQVLSELIRTAFIPEDGKKFIVADFSAIEARVLSYLAGETWRNEVFANGGDIYCASAEKMFKVPVEKNGQNANLRQKGKIAGTRPRLRRRRRRPAEHGHRQEAEGRRTTASGKHVAGSEPEHCQLLVENRRSGQGRHPAPDPNRRRPRPRQI